jgi:hypothetical protein
MPSAMSAVEADNAFGHVGRGGRDFHNDRVEFGYLASGGKVIVEAGARKGCWRPGPTWREKPTDQDGAIVERRER